MAGSYAHCVNDKGDLLGPHALFIDSLDNYGDLYEAIRQMHEMINWLADGDQNKIAKAVEACRP